MAINFDGIELSEEVRKKIEAQNASLNEYDPDEVTRLRNHNETLLGEKKAQQRKAEEEAERAAEAERQRLEQKKDYETLYKTSQETLKEYKEREEATTRKATQEKVNTVALEIAGKLSDGADAELLATFIKGRLRAEGGEIKVTDADGNLTISTFEDLQNEFKGDAKYASLVKVTKASGGGSKNVSNSSADQGGGKKDSVREGLRARLESKGLTNN